MKKRLSQTEFEIMCYIWDRKQEVTAAEIRTHFSNKHWHKQTVSTFLKNLVDFGMLEAYIESGQYYYREIVSKEDYPAMLNFLRLRQKSEVLISCPLYDGDEEITEDDYVALKEKVKELDE